ncbi:alpha/beta hydrolase [Geodermatophilus sp. DF01_2]|uniref:alpha/beta fold hydrolase n=1 Tax=Geodermatophilus sp. DF01-2 TaxID=2559610 RepID=UPI001FD8215F|nr:alpha/beta hydrolase [Geodermatophilus sp. DF01_2]
MSAEPVTTHRDTPFGRMRSRAVGSPRNGLPEVVLVQGMAVADYLLPGLTALGQWTRAHLLELPGFAGSGEPPHPLDVVEYGDAVAAWLDATGLGRVVLMGHSSGTQVAARAAARHPPAVRAVVLASPTIDPRFRGWVRLLIAWRRDGRREPPGLNESHMPEWKRAGTRRLVHTVNIHLADRLEDAVPRLGVPVLVLHGDQDRVCTERWARSLAEQARDGRFASMPGAHTFPWADPHAWSGPIRDLAGELA